MVKPVDRWVKKQIDRVSVAGDDYKYGVENPERNPIEEAIKKKEKWQRKLEEAIKEGRWEKALSKVSLEEWKKAASEKGAPRFVEGVRMAEDKIREFVSKWQPILKSIQDAVRALPDVTDADREKRMIENLRRLKKAKGTWK